jgi:hypothetical protein
MTARFPIHQSPDYTSLSQFWRTSTCILSIRIILVKLHQYIDSKISGRFSNQLLSLEQNKNAPFLNKEMIVWATGEGH